MSINLIIVENEKLFSWNIENMLEQLGKYCVLATFSDAETALPYIEKCTSTIDMILLDIMLDGKMTGIDLANKLIDRKIPILFMTEWQDEASYQIITSFTHHGYLAKPFHKYTLDSSIKLLLSSTHHNQPIIGTDSLTYIRIGAKQEIIDPKTIHWIEANRNYCTIHTQTKQYTVKRSLKTLYSQLPSDQFIFIHKSFIVQLPLIKKIDIKEQIVLIGDKTLPLGRTYIKNLRQHLMQLG